MEGLGSNYLEVFPLLLNLLDPRLDEGERGGVGDAAIHGYSQ